jgi:hypothetical protein
VISVILFLARAEDANPLALLIYSAVIFAICAAAIYWSRFGQRRFQQRRVRYWTSVPGKFDEGEVITMRKGRSGDVSGYQVWFGYEYNLSGEEGGLYILPFRGEFETSEEAEEWRKRLAERPVTVRVSPRNAKRSGISDEDVKPMLGNFVP